MRLQKKIFILCLFSLSIVVFINRVSYATSNNVKSVCSTLNATKENPVDINNNWGPGEYGVDDDFLTHILYSPEDFTFHETIKDKENDEWKLPWLEKILDGRPIGNRIPIILVHGWQGDKDSANPIDQMKYDLSAEKYWENMIYFFTNHYALNKKYKIFLYKYPSYKHVTFNALTFKYMLSLMSELNNKQAIFIGHSMGTLVIRSAFEEHNLGEEKAKKIIFLDGVHHGSPAAIRGWVPMNDWFKDLRTLGANDIQWDNYDGIFQSEKINYQAFYDVVDEIAVGSHYSEVPKIESISSKVTTDIEDRNIYFQSKLRMEEIQNFDNSFRDKIFLLIKEKPELKNALPVFSIVDNAEKVMQSQYYYQCSTTVIPICDKYRISLPVLPNPWLIHLNLLYSQQPREYKEKIIIYASFNANGRNKNNHFSDNWGMGMAEDAVQHLGELFDMDPFGGGHYGYLNDGPVPINSQLLDLKCSYNDLFERSGFDNDTNLRNASAQVTMYFPWKFQGLQDGSSTIKEFTPDASNINKDCLELLDSDGYQGDGFVKHILFMDYDHERMKSGTSSTTSESANFLFIGCSETSDLYSLCYENSVYNHKEYIKNALNNKWRLGDSNYLSIFDSDNACVSNFYNSLSDGYKCSVSFGLRYEPLFLSIIYQMDQFGFLSKIKEDIDLTPPFNQFSDVPKASHWYKQYLKELVELDIMKGYPDKTLRPEAYISRVEALTMIFRAWKKFTKKKTQYSKATSPYTDIDLNAWYGDAILYATQDDGKNPFVQGQEGYVCFWPKGSKLNPRALVTRGDAMHMLVNAIGIPVLGLISQSDAETLINSQKIEIKANHYYYNLIDSGININLESNHDHYYWIKAGINLKRPIATGYNTNNGYTFKPDKLINRAEMAKMLFNAFF